MHRGTTWTPWTRRSTAFESAAVRASTEGRCGWPLRSGTGTTARTGCCRSNGKAANGKSRKPLRSTGCGEVARRGSSAVEPDDLLAVRPHADEPDRHPDEVGDEAEVVARLAGQVAGRAAGAEVEVETRQLLVLRRRRVEDRLVVGEGVEDGAFLGAVANRDPQRAEAAEDVELGDRQRVHAVEADRVAQRHQVHPAAAPPPSRRRPELVAALQHLLADLVFELGREGTGADPRRIGLGDSPDLVDVLRPDTGADAGRAGD